MQTMIDEPKRLAEVRAETRELLRQEQRILYDLGGRVIADGSADVSELHEKLRRTRERIEALLAASLLLDA